MEIEFDASGQRLSRIGPETRPVSGSRGYLIARFTLNEDWDGLRIAGRFFDAAGVEHAALLTEEKTCRIPDAVTGGRWFKVALQGVGNGRTVTTNAVTIMQEVV